MSKIDWIEWILEKNAKVEQEELNKSEFATIEHLAKEATKKLKGHSADKEVNPDWTQQGGKSIFDMSHVNTVAGMKSHDEAKKFAHGIVDASNAKDDTKKKVKGIIDSSKHIPDLARSMTNHILSYQGLNVLGSKVKKTEDQDD